MRLGAATLGRRLTRALMWMAFMSCRDVCRRACKARQVGAHWMAEVRRRRLSVLLLLLPLLPLLLPLLPLLLPLPRLPPLPLLLPLLPLLPLLLLPLFQVEGCSAMAGGCRRCCSRQILPRGATAMLQPLPSPALLCRWPGDRRLAVLRAP